VPYFTSLSFLLMHIILDYTYTAVLVSLPRWLIANIWAPPFNNFNPIRPNHGLDCHLYVLRQVKKIPCFGNCR
ncbi:hypothetical protein INT48_008806, partial [Thamnidium elegans]